MPARIIPFPPRTDATADLRLEQLSTPWPPRRHADARPLVAGKQRRRARWVLPVAVAAAVLAATTAVLLHPDPLTPAAPPVKLSIPAPAPSTASTSVTWHRVQGVYLPQSPTDGPLRQDGPLLTGYSGTDLAAALAAIHIAYQAGPQPGPDVFTPALAREINGPAQADLAASVQADYEQSREASGLPDGAPLGAGTATFTSYRVRPLAGGDRQVAVAESAPDTNGVTQHFLLSLRLHRTPGDWTAIAPSQGLWAQAITALPAAPSGMTPFTPAAPTPPGGQ